MFASASDCLSHPSGRFLRHTEADEHFGQMIMPGSSLRRDAAMIGNSRKKPGKIQTLVVSYRVSTYNLSDDWYFSSLSIRGIYWDLPNTIKVEDSRKKTARYT